MSASGRGSDVTGRAISAWIGVALLVAAPALADAPRRVVSMNLCTDQLALMVAAPGQIVSVSYLAQDQAVPELAALARDLPANRGLAEEVYLMRPDLVLAGPWSALATVAMLEGLGIPVVRFAPENRLDDVETGLRRMGEALGREARAEALIAQFRRDRAALDARAAMLPTLRAAVYSARGWTSGSDTLAGAILRAAGLSNIAGEMGLAYGGEVSLEALILANPDLLISERPSRGWSEARALLVHPALQAMPAYAHGIVPLNDAWSCGTPYVLDAVAQLIDARAP